MRRTISIALVRVGHDGRMVVSDDSERVKSVYDFSMGLCVETCKSAIPEVSDGRARTSPR